MRYARILLLVYIETFVVNNGRSGKMIKLCRLHDIAPNPLVIRMEKHMHCTYGHQYPQYFQRKYCQLY